MSQPNPTFVTIPPNSTGANVRMMQFVENGSSVNSECDEVACPVNPQRQAFTETVSGNSTGSPLVCSGVGGGNVGYLMRVKLISTGPCLWTIAAGATLLGYGYSSGGPPDVYEPPHRFFDQCPAGESFSFTPENTAGYACTVCVVAWWDEFATP